MEPINEENVQAKKFIYKVVAKGKKREGRAMRCDECGKPYTDNIAEDTKGIVCPLCIMGLSDGLPQQKKPKKKTGNTVKKPKK